MWRMLRVGRILICVYTTNKDCLLLLLLLGQCSAGKTVKRGGTVMRGGAKKGKQAQCRKTCRVTQEVQSRKKYAGNAVHLHLSKPRAAHHAEAITKQPTNAEEHAHRLKMTADRMGRREGMIHQYVDDVVVLARTPEELQRMINDIVGVNAYHAMQNPWDEGMDSSEPETEDDD